MIQDRIEYKDENRILYFKVSSAIRNCKKNDFLRFVHFSKVALWLLAPYCNTDYFTFKLINKTRN